MSAITLETRHYRSLSRTSWTPTGVCAVVGPNGAGKTTLFTLLGFLRNAYLRGASGAIDNIGGVYGLKSWSALQEDEPVLVSFAVGELRWELQLTAQGPSLASRLGEKITLDGKVILYRAPLADRLTYRGAERLIAADDPRLAVRIVVDAESPEELAPLVHSLTGLRVYHRYNLWGLQANGSRQGGDLWLHPSGQNAFAVLRNWRDRRDLRPQYDFVIDRLKVAFPQVFEDLSFQVAGLTVTIDLMDPNSQQTIPITLAPDGWLTGLLHLMAVAGAQEGSVVAIDDFGNDLHPFAIRTLTEAFRDWAEEHDLVVCLASHSPVLLDEFRDEPGLVFVMEHGFETRPVPLTELFETDWLARFSLGQLYQHGEFGGQSPRPGVGTAV